MREHMGLYRGKRIDNGEWVEGYLTQHTLLPANGETYLGFVIEPYPKKLWVVESYEVDPDTVGECTGMRNDKGKLLFEGDAIKYKDRFFGEVISVIEYDPEGACFCAHTLRSPNNPALDIVMNESKIELLGPLCDNPELLKGGESE